MKRLARCSGLLLGLLAGLLPGRLPIHAQTGSGVPLKLVETIPLTVRGQLNHMIVDRLNDRAFVAASATGTLEVLDLKTGQTVTHIPGPGKPVEPIYFKKCDCVAYSTSAGALRILDPNTLQVTADVPLEGAAEAVGLDPQHDLAYVAHGSGQAGPGHDNGPMRLSFIDLMTGKKVGSLPVEGGRLGQMALEHHGPRGYLNNTALHAVSVLDLTGRRVADTWKLDASAGDNVAMALDEKNHRLFVGMRKPDTLLVLDTQTGKTVSQLPAAAAVGDISYDATLKRVYMSSDTGVVDVFQQNTPNSYTRLAAVATAPGGGTSKWVPEQSRLCVEVSPRTPSEAARVLVYEAVE